ncbi:hypothetical protein WNZ14_12475 [Hoeflea sp. AS60]|uniref:hypothetical protein n=1 Tax=Hoeflea sp. AS60 TaxID=3135780 RepID=UPI00316EAA62
MQDYPPLADHGRERHRETDSELRQSRDSGISIWIAVAAVIISLGILMVFSQGQLKNGGGPFVITPPTQISAYPAANR